MVLSKPSKPQLSLWQRLLFLLTLLRAVSSAIKASIFGYFYRNRPKSYLHLVAYSAVRVLVSNANSDQEQWFNPDSDVAYDIYCKEKKVAKQVITTPDGTRAYGVGDKSAKRLIVYYHGGGYNLAAGPHHFHFLDDLGKECEKATGTKVASLLLHYNVAPYAAYPYQLKQGISILDYAIHNLGFSPGNIIIAGDSAGGNLCAGVLSCLLHPYPQPDQVPTLVLPEGQKLLGALLISPWVSFETTADSFKRNQYKDSIGSVVLKRWSSLFLGGAPYDPYNQPPTAPEGWWVGASDVVQNVLITGGNDEVLIDGIKEFAGRFQREWNQKPGSGKLQLVMVPDEGHDTAIVCRMFNAPTTVMEKEIVQWAKQVLA